MVAEKVNSLTKRTFSTEERRAAMASQDNRSLLDILQEVSNLPEDMRGDAVKDIIAEWRYKSQLVDEVAGGHTTFEETITALIEENKQLTYLNRKNACSTPQFEAMAKEVATKFTGVFLLSDIIAIPSVGIVVHDLTDKFSLRQSAWSELKFNIGTTLVVILLVWGSFSYFIVRELFAYWQLVIACGIGLGLLLTSDSLLIWYPNYLSARRRLAQKVLEQAKFLDAMIRPQRT